MADSPFSQRGLTPSSIPLKRPYELDDEQRHAPSIPSPLNPDFVAARARKAAPAREQREKKESLKKREAKGVDAPRAATPDTPSHGRKVSKKAPEPPASDTQTIVRYAIPLPKPGDFDPAGPPVLQLGIRRAGQQFFHAHEHVYNRKGFRYTHCVADPAFPSMQYHRQSEVEPFTPRFDYEDSSSHVQFDQSGLAVTTEKGFRMARANVAIREGHWFWECKVLSGVKNTTTNGNTPDGGGHVRLGFSRREASLDTPVGFDAYSYGLRDLAGQKIHKSRPQDFFPGGESVCEGDVIGFEINLPTLALHKKVVEGAYNKAVDVSDDVELQGTEACNVIRDRLPIRYKSSLYFEQFEYQATKEMEEQMYPPTGTAPSTSAASQDPHPNHPHVALRTLPFSYIKVFKNGRSMGTIYTDLFAFLPLASRPSVSTGGVGAREGLDDGSLGYYPSVSVFRGGAARANFGPDFEYPPPDLARTGDDVEEDDDVDMVGEAAASMAGEAAEGSATQRRLRPLCERYNEQIAEDVLYDLLDEVNLWTTDQAARGAAPEGTASKMPRPAPQNLGAGGLAGGAAVGGSSSAGELNEIVQDEE